MKKTEKKKTSKNKNKNFPNSPSYHGTDSFLAPPPLALFSPQAGHTAYLCV